MIEPVSIQPQDERHTNGEWRGRQKATPGQKAKLKKQLYLLDREYVTDTVTLQAPTLYHEHPASKDQILVKRANSKVISDALANRLIALHSPMEKKYKTMLECSRVLTKKGKKFTSTYCNCKACIQCNRIRTGRLMNKYEDLSEYLHDSQFVTLTVRNIYFDQTEIFFANDEIYAGRTAFIQDVKYTQKQMYAALRRIQDRFRKRGVPIKGIKAYECGPAQDKPGAHPHLHWQIDGNIDWDDLYEMWHIDGYSEEKWGDMVCKLLNGKMTVGQMKGELIIQMWMRELPSITDIRGQLSKPCTGGTMRELFKYMTKLFVKKDEVRSVPVHIIDMIFEASVGVKALMITGFNTKRPRADYTKMKEGPDRDKAFEKFAALSKEYMLYESLTKGLNADVNENLEGQELETSETMCVDLDTGELIQTPEPPIIVFVWKENNWYCPELNEMKAVRFKVSNKTRKLIASFNSS